LPESAHDFSRLFIELGAVAIGLALLARIASHWGFSSISLFLLGGLAFGKGGIVPLDLSKEFIQVGAEIGVLLLLFMLGLEYSGEQLSRNLRSGSSAVAIDLLLNFLPGLIAGFLLRFGLVPSILLGGVTFISSSGIIARVLSELNRNQFPETPLLISILVLEDLVMAIYLPLVGVLIAGGGPGKMALSIAIASTTVFAAVFIATHFGDRISRFATHQSDEVILLAVLGTLLLVAGIAQQLQLSAAIGAFLVGIAVSGPVAEQSHRVLTPLRDLFAATFFFFFGLEVDPRSLPNVLPVALALAGATTFTKVLTGYLSTRRRNLSLRSGLRTGLTLVAHGEFSIVIAGLGAGLEPRLGSLSAAYVLLMAVSGPMITRLVR